MFSVLKKEYPVDFVANQQFYKYSREFPKGIPIKQWGNLIGMVLGESAPFPPAAL